MVKVKICGLTNSTDAANARVAGADMIGVIVDTPTPRSVSLKQANRILSAVPQGVGKVVGMRPDGISQVIETAFELQPDYLQINAPMTASELEEIKETTGVQLIVVVGIPERVKSREEIISRALEVAKVTDYVLVDTEYKGTTGGTGRMHDWNMSRAVRKAIDKPLILAGGLNPKNVKKAIRAIDPYGVDVASGVESEFGKKDLTLMREFVKAVKGIPEF